MPNWLGLILAVIVAVIVVLAIYY